MEALTLTRMTAKDPTEKIGRKRLSVLKLAESLGNVSEACRKGGMDRTSFYAWQKRFREQGLDGLKDLPPVHHTHPQTTPPEVEARVLSLSLEHPGWGCVKLSDYLRLEQVQVSSPTIQKLLAKHGMASKYERMLRLEEKHLREGMELTADQVYPPDQLHIF